MSVSLDDKLLGEKAHYYCSSSEDEDEEPKSNQEQPPPRTYQGTCVNTGPKGVIEDWRKYKQLETERRECKEAEKDELVKKLSMTCLSHLNDGKDVKEDLELEGMDDEFLLKYRERRLDEMRKLFQPSQLFGKVANLSSEEFTVAVDSENPQVLIVVHVYEESSEACESMNGCLTCLAQEYPKVKFCKIRASEASMSGHFMENGVPALLIYRNKELVGNFVRLSDELGEDFYANDVECFLIEHGMLPCQDTSNGGTVMPTGSAQDSDSGSDFEID